MEKGARNQFEVPPEIRTLAEAGVQQVRKAFESFLNAAQSTAQAIEGQGSAARAGAREIGTKAISYAEKNMTASLDYAQKLAQAKDISDIMRLHSEYVQSQMRALAEQASEMGHAVTRAAMDATKKPT